MSHQNNQECHLRLNLRILRVKIYMFQERFEWAQLQLLSIIRKNKPYQQAYRICIEYYMDDSDTLFLFISDYEKFFPESEQVLGQVAYANIDANPEKTSEILKEIDSIILREGESSQIFIKYAKWLAFISYEQSNFKKAFEYLQKVEHYYKNDRIFYLFCAHFNYDLKRFNEAIKYFQKAERLIKKYTVDNNLRISVAKAYIQMGNYQRALGIANSELNRMQSYSLITRIEVVQVYSKLNNPRMVLDLIQQLSLQEHVSRNNRINHIINIKILQAINFKKVGMCQVSLKLYHQLNQICEQIYASMTMPAQRYFRLINFLIHFSFDCHDFIRGKKLVIRKLDLLQGHYQSDPIIIKMDEQLLRERNCEEMLW